MTLWVKGGHFKADEACCLLTGRTNRVDTILKYHTDASVNCVSAELEIGCRSEISQDVRFDEI